MSSGARGGPNRRTTMLGLNQGSASQVWAGLRRHPWSDTTPPETQETCEILGPDAACPDCAARIRGAAA